MKVMGIAIFHWGELRVFVDQCFNSMQYMFNDVHMDLEAQELNT